MHPTVPPIRVEKFNVIFTDTFGYRHVGFRVRPGSSSRAVAQRHCHSGAEMCYALRNEGPFDVAFFPGYFLPGESVQEVIQNILRLEERRKPRLVIYHGSEDDNRVVKQLNEAGILSCHIPWDYINPKNHTRISFKRS